MTIRLFGAMLCGAALILATQADLAQAQKDTGATTRATTVKSSKSNTSDRMGGGGGKGAAQSRRVGKMPHDPRPAQRRLSP